MSSSNQQLLLSIIITIILITIIHTPIPMITTTSHMITAHTSMISISTMLIALTGILMKMNLKRKNVGMIIQPIIIIIIQRYRRETSKAITLITTLIWKVSAKHSQ